MSPLGQNITRIMSQRSVTLPKLADLADVDKGNLSRIIKTGSGYSAKSIAKIAAALQVPLWTLFKDGPGVEMLPRGLQRIPILDISKVAVYIGAAHAVRDEIMQETMLTTSNYSTRSFAMKVRDDSMVPDFSIGDLVVVDPDTLPYPGCFVVATDQGNDAILRRYAQRGQPPTGVEIFELVPSNSMYSKLRSDDSTVLLKGVVRERIILFP